MGACPRRFIAKGDHTLSRESNYSGAINQALYFARLLAEQGQLLEQTNDGGRFQGQQLQCYCEASLDALHRSLFFLVQATLPKDDGADSGSAIAPGGLEGMLDRALQGQPSQVLQELAGALRQTTPISAMLQTYRRLWQVKAWRVKTDEISTAEIHLSPSDCLLWQQEITQLHTRIREHGEEY